MLHVTDPHLFADPAGSLRGTVTRASLQSVLDHILASGWPADVVAMTGDLIQDDSRTAYREFRSLLSKLQLPVHCIPGNHDVRALMKEELSMPPFYYCSTFRQRNWAMIGIDSCVSDSAGGHVSDTELNRLRQDIEKCACEHVLVCLHHPPQHVGSRWLDQVGLENGEAFLQLLEDCGRVRACLFGHAHQRYESRHGDIRVVGTPSTCRQFQPGSDDFAVDDLPPAYRRVSLFDDGTVDSELVWVPAPAGGPRHAP